MTIVDRRLFIIGGSLGQDYLRDVYVLDTDPPPEIREVRRGKKKLLQHLRNYVNSEEYSDVTFLVEGRRFYGHKLILSILSPKFQAMFGLAMQEKH